MIRRMRFTRAKWLPLFSLILALAGWTGCKKPDGAAADGDTIPIGEYASLTGNEADFGRSSHRGTGIVIEELNKDGGMLGEKLRLLTENTQSKEGESSTVVPKLISRERVVAVLGDVASSRSLEAGPVCQNNNVPMI